MCEITCMEENASNKEPTTKGNGTEAREESAQNVRDIGRLIYLFAIRTLSIREGADIEGTVEGIRKDIDFKGPNVWILICSIFIASIGLNVNSAAAVIGAMLISPLMGPILGLGLAVGTNDWKMLTRSLKSLGVAVVVSLITSTLYFAITPMAEVQSEILARTKPTSLDVIIAFFGGIAGIVAGSRKEKSNVIPGVAIATALMPPLCTAGFGLATWNLSFFFGAMYLFLINTVFISLSTFLIVRYLGFPIVHFVDPKKERRFKRYIVGMVVLVIIPSTFITYNIITESAYRIREENFRKSGELFIDEVMQMDSTDVVNVQYEYTDSLALLEVFVIGKQISQEQKAEFSSRLADYDLKKTRLRILQDGGDFDSETLLSKLEESYKDRDELVTSKDQIIRDQEQQIKELNNMLDRYEDRMIDMTDLSKEIKIQYPEVERSSYAVTYEVSDSMKIDTIPTLLVRWKGKTAPPKKAEQLQNWLKVRTKVDTIRVIQY